MKYRCRQCEYVDDKPGNCPTCNIPMDILQQDEEQGQPEAAPEMPTEGTPEAAPETTGAPEAPAAPEAPQEGGDSVGEGGDDA